jgi:hypothetical protein
VWMLPRGNVFRPELPDSYLAELATSTNAALRKESRTNFIDATDLNRKGGGAEWRDLRFSFQFSSKLQRSCKVTQSGAGLDAVLCRCSSYSCQASRYPLKVE